MALTVLMLTGCGESVAGGAGAGGTSALSWSDLDGRTFVSTQATKDAEPYPLVKGTAVSIRFADQGISAGAGCNTMGGPATLDGATLVVSGGLATTEMGCDPDRMAQDTWLAQFLTDRPTLRLDGDRLTMTTATYGLQLADEKVAHPDQALEGTPWLVVGTITGAGSDGAVSSIPAGIEARLLLTDGRLSVTGGCNVLGADYVLDGDQLVTSNLISTMKYCPGAKGDLERHLTQVLDGTMTVAVDGDRLTLVNGDLGLLLRAVPDPAPSTG